MLRRVVHATGIVNPYSPSFARRTGAQVSPRTPAAAPALAPCAKVRRRLLKPLRERLDVALFVRSLLGASGYSLLRVVPRWRIHLPKEYCVHAVVLLVVGLVVATNFLTTSADRESLLFALFGEGEIEEGPVLRPERAGGNRRGTLLGLIPPASAGGVTEGDIEFELANTFGGNSLVATGSPETAEASLVRRGGVVAVRVQDGDTPSSIAARYGVSANTVLWANGIRDGDIIRPGDVLVVLPVSGVLHTVVGGDDVTSLAQKYDARVEDIIARNGLSDDGAIRIGQKLVIPDGQIRQVPPRLASAAEEVEPEASPSAPPALTPVPGSGLLWPAAARRVSQYFTWGHTGIDLPDKGVAVAKAAQDGTVEFAGWLGGYGKLVILDHGTRKGRNLETYYAHLKEIHVEKGQTVSRGQSVGYVGSTGRSTGQHLHFEVREDGRPGNPLRYF